VTTTSTIAGKTRTTTRIVQGKWIGAACGDIKPIAPPSGRGRWIERRSRVAES
jgi:hypothetical protein